MCHTWICCKCFKLCLKTQTTRRTPSASCFPPPIQILTQDSIPKLAYSRSTSLIAAAITDLLRNLPTRIYKAKCQKSLFFLTSQQQSITPGSINVGCWVCRHFVGGLPPNLLSNLDLYHRCSFSITSVVTTFSMLRNTTAGKACFESHLQTVVFLKVKLNPEDNETDSFHYENANR